MMPVDLLQDIGVHTHLLNAAGTLGFAPSPHSLIDLDILGAFVTNPISLQPRFPAESRCLVPFQGGYLLHTGLPNPGLKEVVRKYAVRWAASSNPIIAHLLADDPDEIQFLEKNLEDCEGIRAFELGFSPEMDAAEVVRLAAAAQGELPIIPNIPPDCVYTWGRALFDHGFRLISLGAPRGLLPLNDGRLVSGRLYGPAVLPYTLEAIRQARRIGLEVIAGGGMLDSRSVHAASYLGACAVQLDAAIWSGTAGQVVWENG